MDVSRTKIHLDTFIFATSNSGWREYIIIHFPVIFLYYNSIVQNMKVVNKVPFQQKREFCYRDNEPVVRRLWDSRTDINKAKNSSS